MPEHRRVWICLISLGTLAACNRAAEPSGTGQPTTTALSVVVGPGPGLVNLCDSLQLTVAVRDAVAALVVPDSIRWWSSDTTVIAISRSGMSHARTVAAADTLRATVWRSADTGTGQLVMGVIDSRVLVSPCPTGGSVPCVLPCPPGF